MKKTFILSVSLLTLFIFASPVLQAQKKNKSVEPAKATSGMSDDYRASEIAFQKEIYKMALKYGDGAEAKGALYALVALGAEDGAYRDSLARIYFNSRAFGNVILIGDEVLEEDPDNQQMLALMAVSRQAMGMDKEALVHYEKLYKLSNDVYFLYQIASVQFLLERYGECKSSVDEIVKVEDAATREIQLNYDQGETQNVPIAAAALNIKGFVQMTTGDNEAAAATFGEALKMKPDFALAIANLAAVNKNMEEQEEEEGQPAPDPNK